MKPLTIKHKADFVGRARELEKLKLFLKNRSNKEILDAYLTVGGVPEYLKKIKYLQSKVGTQVIGEFEKNYPYSPIQQTEPFTKYSLQARVLKPA